MLSFSSNIWVVPRVEVWRQFSLQISIPGLLLSNYLLVSRPFVRKMLGAFSFQCTRTRPRCFSSFCRCCEAVFCGLLVPQQLDGPRLGSRPLCSSCEARDSPFPFVASGIFCRCRNPFLRSCLAWYGRVIPQALAVTACHHVVWCVSPRDGLLPGNSCALEGLSPFSWWKDGGTFG